MNFCWHQLLWESHSCSLPTRTRWGTSTSLDSRCSLVFQSLNTLMNILLLLAVDLPEQMLDGYLKHLLLHLLHLQIFVYLHHPSTICMCCCIFRMPHFSDAAFLDCNNILHLCHVASWCLYSWTLTSKHIFLQFNDIINTVFASGPTVALIVSSVLDNTLEARGYDSDRGLSWFTPFLRRHKGYSDPRNDEFYSFPIRVHDFVPSRFLWLSHERCYCACKSLCSW